jgi:hypothetical protein
MFRRFNLLVITLILSGCTFFRSSPSSFLPLSGTIASWSKNGDVHIYNSGNLFDFIDGQADAFIAYDLIQVAVQSYQDISGNLISVEIWQVINSDDAYGLFTRNRSGVPVKIGNDGDSDPGRLLAYWQGPYYVRLFANQSIPDNQLVLFAHSISSALPSGGGLPEIVQRLPTSGLIENSRIFFHKEISIQDDLWLGGKNILGLTSDTMGALAYYEIQGKQFLIVLIQYPKYEQALAGKNALQTNAIDGSVTVTVQGATMGAIFGEINQDNATQILEQALGNP